MKILHIISGLGTGGAESFLANLAIRLKQRGFEQTIASLTGDGPTAEQFESAGIPVEHFDVRGLLKAPSVARALSRFINQNQPSVVQGWMYHGDLFATLAHLLSNEKSTRLMWNIRCSEMHLENYHRQLKLVVKSCIHLSQRPDVIIANSQAGAQSHLAARYRPRRLEVIRNGVDAERFRPDPASRASVRAELGISSDQPVIIHVARVDPMKDHPTLLQAIKPLQNATTLLVGLGTEEFTLPDNVIALGRRSDMPQLLAASDIIVSSSAYGEGFSNAIGEGMAAELVPVATDVGDTKHIIDDTGRVTAPRDTDALSDALGEMLSLKSSVRKDKGRAARRRIVENFTLERAVDRYHALYLETVEA